MSSRYSSSPSAWLHLNFYQQLDEYPEYGIVHYSYDTKEFQHADDEYFRDSLRMIRTQFGNAYRDGNLQQWSGELSKAVPWELKFVAILLGDSALENATVDLGVIIPASDLFDDKVTTAKIAQKYKLERGRHRTDTSEYPIIESHIKANAG